MDRYTSPPYLYVMIGLKKYKTEIQLQVKVALVFVGIIVAIVIIQQLIGLQ